MFVCLPASPPLCCLLGNVCHSVAPPLARPTLGRTQASPDAKPLLPFHLLPGFADVSTVRQSRSSSQSASKNIKRNCNNSRCSLLLRVGEFVSPKPSSHAKLFFSTQMHERAAHTFPNISRLMLHRAVTFPHNLGGEVGAASLVFLAHGLRLPPVFVEGEGGEN